MATHVYEVVAHNYALESDNKVHDDAVAARYGFRGGLVPGAADFAYLAHAVHGLWGDDWLHEGAMDAKFIKPIYHGELARAEARATDENDRLELALVDIRGETCAVGQARRACDESPPCIEDFPSHALERPDALPPPTADDFPRGHRLGDYTFVHDSAASLEEIRALFVEPIVNASGDHPWHPGLCPHLGNQILRNNVRLGPWVHTASSVCLFGAPEDGDRVCVRGTVADTYEKRGHIMTDCDVALFANEERALVMMRHTAIIRLAGDA